MLRFKIVSSGISTYAGTDYPRTMLQIYGGAASVGTGPVFIEEWSISFAGTAPDAAPIKVDVIRQGDVVSTGTNPVTIQKDPDDYDETPNFAAYYASEPDGMVNMEPTINATLMSMYVHPQRSFTWKAIPGREIKVGMGDYLGIATTAASAVVCGTRMVCYGGAGS